MEILQLTPSVKKCSAFKYECSLIEISSKSFFLSLFVYVVTLRADTGGVLSPKLYSDGCPDGTRLKQSA